ncbi:dihydrofolate reductase [Candidatus Roizmanbacteria bacterium]|nr:dihydrofolate reductase [Candidatus Roizmanbacteria bacterium]
MKTKLIMAMSLNGIIAASDGNEDFLSHTNWIHFCQLTRQTGSLIWGRKTYEAVITWDKSYLRELEGVKKVILSHSSLSLKDGFTLAHSPEDALDFLKKEGCSEVVITGGSTINSEFAIRNLIDEVVLLVNPSLLGQGAPLFRPADFLLPLTFQKMVSLEDDILELHYQVKKER